MHHTARAFSFTHPSVKSDARGDRERIPVVAIARAVRWYYGRQQDEREHVGQLATAGQASAFTGASNGSVRWQDRRGLNFRSTHKPRGAAAERAEALRSVFAELAGMSTRAVAAELDRRGIATPSGAAWSAMAVLRVRERLAT